MSSCFQAPRRWFCFHKHIYSKGNGFSAASETSELCRQIHPCCRQQMGAGSLTLLPQHLPLPSLPMHFISCWWAGMVCGHRYRQACSLFRSLCTLPFLPFWPLKLPLCCHLLYYSALLLYLQEAKEGGLHSRCWALRAHSPSPCVWMARQAKQQGRDCHSFTTWEEVRNEKCFRKRPKSC